MMTMQNRPSIEIRPSKAINLFYASIALFLVLAFNVKAYPELKNDTSLLWIDLIISLFFSSFGLYFIVKSADKKPICIIDQDKVSINKTDLTYELKDLEYFRHEEIYAKTTISHLQFFNSNKNLIINIPTTNTDIDYEKVKSILR
ncbi:MAG: hypothetical protein ACKOXR_08960 [Bacteroidota bacterium]